MNNTDLGFVGGEVEGTHRTTIPTSNETIADDMHIDEVAKAFSAIRIYFRDKESCPFNRGNWVIDFFSGLNRIIPSFCMKLPAEMKEEDVHRWAKPLGDKFKNKHN